MGKIEQIEVQGIIEGVVTNRLGFDPWFFPSSILREYGPFSEFEDTAVALQLHLGSMDAVTLEDQGAQQARQLVKKVSSWRFSGSFNDARVNSPADFIREVRWRDERTLRSLAVITVDPLQIKPRTHDVDRLNLERVHAALYNIGAFNR